MSIIMVEKNRKSLTEKVNKGEEEVLQAIHRLAEELAAYGFRGIIAGELKVTVVRDFDGAETGSVTRSFSFPYCR